MALISSKVLTMTLNSLVGGQNICLKLLEKLRTTPEKQSIISSEFLRQSDIKVKSETFKKYLDILETQGLIDVQVMRNEAGRPNKIMLTDKGKIVIDKLLELQNILENT